MQFTIPTTRQQMYDTLNDLYNYYRLRRLNYDGVNLDELSIEKIVFTPSTDAELLEKAAIDLSASQKEKVLNRTETLNKEKVSLEAKLSSLDKEAETEAEEISKAYKEAEETFKKTAIKNGLINSTVIPDKLAELRKEKGEKIAKIQADKISLKAEIQAKINSITTLLQNVSTYYEDVFAAEINAKIVELKDAEAKLSLEAFKYNNLAQEKELKYNNSILRSEADLELKYIQIKANELSKEELIDMGYYSDVIACVCGYYNSLTPVQAYTDIRNEPNLAIYLDDYYQQIVYFYKVNAE